MRCETRPLGDSAWAWNVIHRSVFESSVISTSEYYFVICCGIPIEGCAAFFITGSKVLLATVIEKFFCYTLRPPFKCCLYRRHLTHPFSPFLS